MTGVQTCALPISASFQPTGSTVPGNGEYLPAANTLGWATNGTAKMYLDPYGNVSIGTTSVSQASGGIISLTVNGTSGSLLGLYTGGTTSKGYLYSNGSQLYLVSDSTGGPLQLQVSSANPMLFFVNGSERARISATGQLLVGATSTPAGSASILAVNSAAGGGIELANNNNGGGNVSALVGGGLSFSTFTCAVGSEVYTPRMVINSSGGVGIGTSAPAYNLDVFSSATGGNTPSIRLVNSANVLTNSFGPFILFQNGLGGASPSNPYLITQFNGSGNAFVIANAVSPYTAYLQITQNGNVVIGSPAGWQPSGATATLTVNGATGGGIELANNNNGGGNIAGLSGGGLSFSTFTGAVGSETYLPAFIVNSGGQVGIGTNSPIERLDVYQNTVATGYQEVTSFRVPNNAGSTTYTKIGRAHV